MSLIMDDKVETIEIPVSYKKIFLKIVDNFSPSEVEEKIFIKEEDYLFFSEKQEKELASLKSYKKLKKTINNTFWWK